MLLKPIASPSFYKLTNRSAFADVVLRWLFKDHLLIRPA